MDFFEEAGKVALGSRLRRLGEMFSSDAVAIYGMYGVDLKPGWFPVFHILSQCAKSSITKMAREIGYRHPVISSIVKEMTRAGLTETWKSAEDKRMSLVKLTAKGRALIPRLEVQIKDVESAVEELLSEMEHDIWPGIMEMEVLLKRRSLRDRVAQKHEARRAGRAF